MDIPGINSSVLKQHQNVAECGASSNISVELHSVDVPQVSQLSFTVFLPHFFHLGILLI